MVPLTLEVVGDRETAVTVFEKLVGRGTRLSCSNRSKAASGGDGGRLSDGTPSSLSSSTGGVSSLDGAPFDVPDGDPLDGARALLARFQAPVLPNLPPLHTGVVGYLGYDCVRYVERLPDRPGR